MVIDVQQARMEEANPVKFYIAKYFFLALGFLQWLVCALTLLTSPVKPKSLFTALIFFSLGTILIFIFSVITDRMKRVAVGKNKIIIREGDKNVRFDWPEIKSLEIIPFLNLYKLKVKGKKKSIYFFPSQNIDPAFGLLSKDTSRMGNILQKKKKEFGIK